MTMQKKILNFLKIYPGSTDREITDSVIGNGKPQQYVNQVCRKMERNGKIVRNHRHNDGLIGNFITAKNSSSVSTDKSIAIFYGVASTDVKGDLSIREIRMKVRRVK